MPRGREAVIRSILSFAALVWSMGCASGVPVESLPVVTKVSTVARSTMAAADGVALAYELRGAGEVALVFVHCWACDRSFWKEQLDVFDDDYQVVALDLPGHGASGRREGGTLAELGEDVAQVVKILGLHRVILIGHSMGGPVSLAAAKLLPGKVAGVIGLDTLHNAELIPPSAMIDQMTAALEKDFQGTMASFVRSAFSPQADPTVVEWVVTKAQAAEPAVALELLKDFPSLDLRGLFTAAGVPIRCVNAAARGSEGTQTQVEINRRYADFDAEVVEGVGHFLQLEKPEEVNPRIRRWVEEILAAEAPH